MCIRDSCNCMYVKSMCRWPEFIVWTCHGLGRVGQGEVQGQFLKMKYSWHPKSRNLKKPSFKQMGSSCIKQTVDQCIKDNPVWSFYKTQTCACSLAETCGVEMWLRLSFPFSHLTAQTINLGFVTRFGYVMLPHFMKHITLFTYLSWSIIL